MIRVTCNATGDAGIAETPEAAISAAVQLNLDAGTTPGYRTFTFADDETGETIRSIDGVALAAAARSVSS